METFKFWATLIAIMAFFGWVATAVPGLAVPIAIAGTWLIGIIICAALAGITEWAYNSWHRVGGARNVRRD